MKTDAAHNRETAQRRRAYLVILKWLDGLPPARAAEITAKIDEPSMHRLIREIVAELDRPGV